MGDRESEGRQLGARGASWGEGAMSCTMRWG